MAVISGLAAATAKLAGLSTAAKAGAGLSIALASLGTAGTAGVLPDPAQARFDTAVERVTRDRAAPPAGANDGFGERVSDDARDGGVDGGEISEAAQQRGEQHRPTQLPGHPPAEAGRPSPVPASGDPAGQRPASPPSPPIERPEPAAPEPARP